METGYKIVCINCSSDRIDHYVDENGNTVYYAIQLSGEDGSLYLGQYSNAE